MPRIAVAADDDDLAAGAASTSTAAAAGSETTAPRGRARRRLLREIRARDARPPLHCSLRQQLLLAGGNNERKETRGRALGAACNAHSCCAHAFSVCSTCKRDTVHRYDPEGHDEG